MLRKHRFTRIKTMAHLRDNGIRPNIVLEPAEHPLSIEQKNGISESRLIEIISTMDHINDKEMSNK
jgi:hypothetical protein